MRVRIEGYTIKTKNSKRVTILVFKPIVKRKELGLCMVQKLTVYHIQICPYLGENHAQDQ